MHMCSMNHCSNCGACCMSPMTKCEVCRRAGREDTVFSIPSYTLSNVSRCEFERAIKEINDRLDKIALNQMTGNNPLGG